MTASAVRLEPLSRVSLVGLRFVDAALGSLVGSGLRVEAYPVGNPKRRVSGVQTPSGVFAFHGLPGMRELEFGTGDQAYWDGLVASPPLPRQRFVFEVQDAGGRFYPTRLERDLPIRFRPDPAAPPQPGPVPLFSVPARPLPAGWLGVYGELYQSSSEPAPWALLRVSGTGFAGSGVADPKGRVLVLLPYPDPGEALPVSPPGPWQWQASLGAALFPRLSPPGERERGWLEVDHLPSGFTADIRADPGQPVLTQARLVEGSPHLQASGAPLKRLFLS
ncbi:MAG TPA: hypothetical protein VFS50_11080 [Meiothermus sp.]|jgi:hypothetical protein|nr:hypothetical protein [Meiothermus sp.]